MTWFDLIVEGLAVFRLALLISKEDGPGWIFRRLRNAPPKDSSVREGIRCEWCVSIWMAVFVMMVRWIADSLGKGAVHDLLIFFLWTMAISAIGVILNQAFTKDSK